MTDREHHDTEAEDLGADPIAGDLEPDESEAAAVTGGEVRRVPTPSPPAPAPVPVPYPNVG